MKRAKGCCRQYICIYIYTDICVHNYMYCYILSLLRHHQLTTVVTTIWLQFYGQAIQQVDPQSSSGPWSEKRLMSWSGAQCTPEMMSLPWVCHGETSGNDDSSKKTFGHHVLRHPFFFELVQCDWIWWESSTPIVGFFAEINQYWPKLSGWLHQIPLNSIKSH